MLASDHLNLGGFLAAGQSREARQSEERETAGEVRFAHADAPAPLSPITAAANQRPSLAARLRATRCVGANALSFSCSLLRLVTVGWPIAVRNSGLDSADCYHHSRRSCSWKPLDFALREHRQLAALATQQTRIASITARGSRPRSDALLWRRRVWVVRCHRGASKLTAPSLFPQPERALGVQDATEGP